ncbi:MAG TPA: polyprenyl synthetase family protein [Nitrolancea sp.]|nr:polyprenyl synthetase family protein [Nitrolancea sp.]
MRDAISVAEAATARTFSARDLPLYGMIRYHLGWADESFRPARFDAGKRIRPIICMHACGAVNGDPANAAPLAAAIEILHNFTLVHDDIQDRSATRRHRSTIWSLWGESQAINVGDAMFALGQHTLLRLFDLPISVERLARVVRGYNDVALRIVEGQVLDLGFEERWDISAAEYLGMIGGKSAAIISYAAWSGALVGGADFGVSERFRAFGEALGLGFQIRDDLLGIWGETSVTGKRKGDDIRRRKKSLPIITLAANAAPHEVDRLRAIYAVPEISERDFDWIVQLLQRYEVEDQLQSVVSDYHERARNLIDDAAEDNSSRRALVELLERLSTRAF